MAYSVLRRGLLAASLVSSSLAAALLGGCTFSGDPPEPGGIVHRYQQNGAARNADIYWFETQAGPVLVDVPLTVSAAKAMKKGLERPYRIYITAARAERFASLDTMREGGVIAATTPAIATEIRDYGGNRLAAARKAHGKDVPGEVMPPSPTVEERTHAMLGETEVEVIPLGPAESESSLAIYLPKTGELITGDVVGGGVHLDLTWGRSVVWQDRINELKALNPKWVYPGHGLPGGPELLDQSAAYLKFFHDVVAEHVKPGQPPKIAAADKKAIKQQIMAKYGKLSRTELVDRSIAAEYAVQMQALPAAGAAPGAALPSDAPTAPAANAPAPPPAAASTPSPSSTPAPSNDDLLDTDTKSKKKKRSK